MPNDDRRSPGRLRPPRADYGWEPPPSEPLPQRARDNYHSDWDADLPDARTIDEEDVVDGQFSFDAPPAPHRSPDGYNSRPDYSTYQMGESKYASAAPAAQPQPVRPQVITPASRSPHIDSQSSGESGDNGLSLQERHQLLIHTIGLYSDEWKLAGIRANAQRNRLEAYLVPLNHHMDLKEAISKNIALLIMIDRQGNTDIREPKPKGPLRRLGGWFFGGE